MKKGALAGVVIAVAIVAALVLILTLTPQAAENQRSLAAQEWGFDGSKGGPAIRVKAGESVRITLTNRGSINHDFWVVENVDSSVQIVERGGKASSVFPKAQVESVRPGQSVSITFTPDRPGNFFYVCLQKDPVIHAKNGMFADFIVE